MKYRLNSLELASFMLKDPYISQMYGGVIARDQIPLYVDKPSLYIVNTDPSTESGEHWFCIYYLDIPEYFDSSGLKPPKDIENNLYYHGSKYMCSSFRVQSYFSETCGLFCLFYCYFRSRGFSFSAIMNMFSHNLNLNEVIVKSFYEETK